MSERIRREFAAAPHNVREARHAVARFLDETPVGAERRGEVLLAVSEAVTNAVVHAYRDGTPGDVEVHAWRTADELVITVRDFGRGMCPNPQSPGLGVGLSIMAASCARLEVRHRRPGTEVEMRFRRD